MKVKFINIGKDQKSFEDECKVKLTEGEIEMHPENTVSDVVLKQIQGLSLPNMLTRSQLLDKYLKSYEGKDVTCKDVIAAAKSLGVKVNCKKIDIGVITQVYMKTPPKKPVISRKKEPVQRKYIEDPVKLIDLKTKFTFKEIGKMYDVNANKIFEDIKHYKRKVLEQQERYG